ncbi:MAG: hypothetical protein AB1746_07365 [Candidatus Zixiibacteriota bacterium]
MTKYAIYIIAALFCSVIMYFLQIGLERLFKRRTKTNRANLDSNVHNKVLTKIRPLVQRIDLIEMQINEMTKSQAIILKDILLLKDANSRGQVKEGIISAAQIQNRAIKDDLDDVHERMREVEIKENMDESSFMDHPYYGERETSTSAGKITFSKESENTDLIDSKINNNILATLEHVHKRINQAATILNSDALDILDNGKSSIPDVREQRRGSEIQNKLWESYLSSLTDMEKHVMTLAILENHSYAEISEILSIPISSVGTVIHGAILKAKIHSRKKGIIKIKS